MSRIIELVVILALAIAGSVYVANLVVDSAMVHIEKLNATLESSIRR